MFCAVTTEITLEILRKKDFSQSNSKFNNLRSHFRSYCVGFSVFAMFSLVTTEDCVEFHSITTLLIRPHILTTYAVVRASKRSKLFKFPNPPQISTAELKVLMKDQQQIRIPDQMEPPCPEIQFTLKMAASSKDAETCL